jgi:hypothetical protein
MKLFCALCGEPTEREVSVDANGEMVATCACGRFLKFPGSILWDYNPQPQSNPIDPPQSNDTPKVSLWRKILRRF